MYSFYVFINTSSAESSIFGCGVNFRKDPLVSNDLIHSIKNNFIKYLRH